MSQGIESPSSQPFVDRRNPNQRGTAPGVERRQFANSYEELSPAARELAQAIDSYKWQHHRRFLTFEEMICVIESVGYHK